ncbi:unnamed protein product [Urochloa humidicola]
MAIEMLPDDLAISVAGLLAASSPDPMQDLRSLRRSCKWMCQVCKSRHVAKSIPVQHALERELFAVPHYGRDYRNDLIAKLAEAGIEEACFRDGLRNVFDVYRSELDCPLDNLKSAADKGHNLAAYLLALCLYRRNGGAVDDEKAKELIRKLEGEDGPGAAVFVSGGRTMRVWLPAFGLLLRRRPMIHLTLTIGSPLQNRSASSLTAPAATAAIYPARSNGISLRSSAVKTAEFASSAKFSSTNISCRSV